MPQPTETTRADCRVIISDDNLSAFLSPIGDEAVELQLDQIQHRLAEIGLSIPLEQLNPFIKPLLTPGNLYRLDSKIQILSGTPPVDEQSERLEPLDIADPADPAEPANAAEPDVPDHYHRCNIRVVKSGQPLAKLHPASIGKPGVDVFGHPIPFNASKSPPVNVGQNITHNPADQILSAACDGSLILDGGAISIDQLIHVKNNVDFSTGNINFPGDVLIQGSVADLFEVRAANISVHGAVEAASLVATGNVLVDGGILGKEKGKIIAGANLAARFISNSTATASGNITVISEITNSHVSCGGKVTVARGAVVGGTLVSNGGLDARSIGSPSQVQTHIEVGSDPQMIEFAAGKLDHIEKQRALIEKTRKSIEPLLSNLKRLNPQQREKATELLYNADEQEQIIKKELQELYDRWKKTQELRSPEIEFHKNIFPGVHLHFPGHELIVRQTLNGPAKILIKTIHSESRLAILHHNSSHPSPLESIPAQVHAVERRLKALLA